MVKAYLVNWQLGVQSLAQVVQNVIFFGSAEIKDNQKRNILYKIFSAFNPY